MIESKIWYKATETFSSQDGEKWTKYKSWVKLPQLSELVSLDNSLCTSVLETLNEEDWQHNVHLDYCCDYFHDLEYLLKRIPNTNSVNILATIREPTDGVIKEFNDSRFVFCGFDLLDETTAVSALTNCGGFPESFANSELTQLGLLSRFERAREVQDALLQNNPNEPHADCTLWALWRIIR